jgi:hypothetical protein
LKSTYIEKVSAVGYQNLVLKRLISVQIIFPDLEISLNRVKFELQAAVVHASDVTLEAVVDHCDQTVMEINRNT